MKTARTPEREELLKFFSSAKYRPMRRAEIYSHFGIRSEGSREVKATLKDMERAGEIVRVKGGRYAAPSDSGLLTGRLEANERGFAFLIPENGKGEDAYIARHNISGAVHGDRVLARLVRSDRGKRGKRREAKVVEILSRGRDTFVGTLEKRKKTCIVIPDDPRVCREITVSPGEIGGARAGQKVLVRIVNWHGGRLCPEGVISEVLGDAGEPKTDLLSIIREYGFRTKFSRALRDEARGAAAGHSLHNRKDFRGIPTFTIDPPDAKDFDDAVSLGREGKNWILSVHIADVSHYVKPGGLLDEEARERATSVYLHPHVLPMLPEILSNDICSLRENEDRLTMSALITFSPIGQIISSRFTPSVIRSRKRFTYGRVGALLRGETAPCDEAEAALLPVLKEMERLALLLREKRFARGALDLDMPEAVITFDREGRVSSVKREEFDSAHILIEEFMIAANEAVASFFISRRAPAIWRVHEPPEEEALRAFVELIAPFGYSVRSTRDPKAIQSFLNRLKGKPESYALQLAFLRSLKIARYSSKNIGHYGLGSRQYLYFTSPIRRYPDIVTHRILRQLLSAHRAPVSTDLEKLAGHCSDSEQRAEWAEREYTTLRKMQYLKGHLESGMIDILEGVITGIRDFGLSIYINDYLLQGLIHISNLRDDYYRVSADRSCMIGRRTKRRFRVGDPVTVQVARVDIPARQVDFVPAER